MGWKICYSTMIIETEGIVINYFKYKESSIIIKILTEEYGFQSFLLNGVRSIRSKKSIGSFQSLNVLELVAYKSSKSDIYRLNEFKLLHLTPSFQINLKKSAMVMFCTELLSKTLFYERTENRDLYQFLKNEIIIFDQLKEEFESYHIYFSIKYASYLGFLIQSVDCLLPFKENLSSPLYIYLDNIIRSERYIGEPTTGTLRSSALKHIINYYSLHMENLGEIKSLKVLSQVFK